MAFKDENLYKEELPPVPDIEAMRADLTFPQFDIVPGSCTVHHGPAGAIIAIDLIEENYSGNVFSCRDPQGKLWSFCSYNPWE